MHQQAPKPQSITFSLHGMSSNDSHICASTALQIALMHFEKSPAAVWIYKCCREIAAWQSTSAQGAETSPAFLGGYLHNSLIIQVWAQEHSGWSNEPHTSCWVSPLCKRLHGEGILIKSAVWLFCNRNTVKVMIFIFVGFFLFFFFFIISLK